MITTEKRWVCSAWEVNSNKHSSLAVITAPYEEEAVAHFAGGLARFPGSFRVKVESGPDGWNHISELTEVNWWQVTVLKRPSTEGGPPTLYFRASPIEDTEHIPPWVYDGKEP